MPKKKNCISSKNKETTTKYDQKKAKKSEKEANCKKAFGHFYGIRFKPVTKLQRFVKMNFSKL